jgi:hypothetical protein
VEWTAAPASKKPPPTAVILSEFDPIIKNDFKEVRSYVEYTRAMLETGESVSKAAATLAQCKSDGELEPAFIGLYGGLLFLDKKYAEARHWEPASIQRSGCPPKTKLHPDPTERRSACDR